MSDLDRLAERVGIEPFYHDIWGNRRDTSRATQLALITAMGLDVGSDEAIARSLRAVEESPWRRMLPPVLVLDEGAPLAVPVSAPAGCRGGTGRASPSPGRWPTGRRWSCSPISATARWTAWNRRAAGCWR